MMMRLLRRTMPVLCVFAIVSIAVGEEPDGHHRNAMVNAPRNAMVNGPRNAMVNALPDRPAAQAAPGGRGRHRHHAVAGLPSHFHHHPIYYGQPIYYGNYSRGYGYRPYYDYRSYPRYYGGSQYGYGGPVFAPAGAIFGPASVMRFMMGR